MGPVRPRSPVPRPAPRSDERAIDRDAATWANVVRLPTWQGGPGELGSPTRTRRRAARGNRRGHRHNLFQLSEFSKTP